MVHCQVKASKLSVPAQISCSTLFFSYPLSNKPDGCYPDLVAIAYDPVNLWLSCVYKDHSLYVWGVQDLQRVGRVHSSLYHSACVWDLQVNIFTLSQD